MTKEEIIDLIWGLSVDLDNPSNWAATVVNGEDAEDYMKFRNEILEEVIEEIKNKWVKS